MKQLIICLALLAAASEVHGSIFSVGHAGAVSRKGKVRFETVLADSDNSWNYRSSRFECSDPGYYYISFHGIARINSGLTLKLVQNGVEIARGHGDGSGYNTASNSVIVFLNHGDKIALRVEDGEIHESSHLDRNYATLSGYKVGGGDGGGPQFGEEPSAFAAPASGEAPPRAETGTGGSEDFTPLSSEAGGPSR